MLLQHEGQFLRNREEWRPIVIGGGATELNPVLNQYTVLNNCYGGAANQAAGESKRGPRKIMSYVCHSPGPLEAFTRGGYWP